MAQGHPLREYGVSDEQLESGLRLCGAVEVGQPLKKRLFALTHNDRVMKYPKHIHYKDVDKGGLGGLKPPQFFCMH